MREEGKSDTCQCGHSRGAHKRDGSACYGGNLGSCMCGVFCLHPDDRELDSLTSALSKSEGLLKEAERERDEAIARASGAEQASATLGSYLTEHSELNGHIEIAVQCRDYLSHEAMGSGDPTGKLRDFVASLEIVIDQCERQRRSRNWYEVAYSAGKQKLIEAALDKVCCKGEPHTCDQEAIAAAEGRTDRVIIERDSAITERDSLREENARLMALTGQGMEEMERMRRQYDVMMNLVTDHARVRDELRTREVLAERERDVALAQLAELREPLERQIQAAIDAATTKPEAGK